MAGTLRERVMGEAGLFEGRASIDSFRQKALNIFLPADIEKVIAWTERSVRNRYPREDSAVIELITAQRVFRAPDISSIQDARYMTTFALAVVTAQQLYNKEQIILQRGERKEAAQKNASEFVSTCTNRDEPIVDTIRRLQREGKYVHAGVLSDMWKTVTANLYNTRLLDDQVRLIEKMAGSIVLLEQLKAEAVMYTGDKELVEKHVQELERRVDAAFPSRTSSSS